MSPHQPYEHYRELLGTLSTDQIPLALLDEAGQHCGWWRSHRPWQRTYARFHLGESPILTFIYETTDVPQAICVIDLLPTFPTTFTPHQTVIRRQGLGWFRLRRFPHDPQLPALGVILALPGAARVMRYRPHKRCTLRFAELPATHLADYLADYAGTSCFAKLFADDRGRAIHQDSLALWQASRQGELAFAVAQPLHWAEAQQTLWQGAVAGMPILAQLLSPAGPALAERLGRAAASLPRSSLQPSQRSDAKKQQKRSTQYADRLRAFLPVLAPALADLLARLTAIHRANGAQRLRPIHGAPHPHQWLADGDRLGLVDFDGLAWGEPELDVATFLAEMDFEDGAQVPVAAINGAFQAGYEAVAGPLNPQLLNAYRAHKRLSKALRNAYAVRSDNDLRVERALEQALAAVG